MRKLNTWPFKSQVFLSNSGIQKTVEVILRLPMSPRTMGRNLTHERENNPFTLKTTTRNPLDFEREDLGNEYGAKNGHVAISVVCR